MSKYTEPMKLIDFVEQFVAHNTVVEIYSLELVPEKITDTITRYCKKFDKLETAASKYKNVMREVSTESTKTLSANAGIVKSNIINRFIFIRMNLKCRNIEVFVCACPSCKRIVIILIKSEHRRCAILNIQKFDTRITHLRI